MTKGMKAGVKGEKVRAAQICFTKNGRMDEDEQMSLCQGKCKNEEGKRMA